MSAKTVFAMVVLWLVTAGAFQSPADEKKPVSEKDVSAMLRGIRDGSDKNAVATAYTVWRSLGTEELQMIKTAQMLFADLNRTQDQERHLDGLVVALGFIGTKDTCSLLVRHIAYQPAGVHIRAKTVGDRYMCLKALVRIGWPALNDLVKGLAESENEQDGYLISQGIVAIMAMALDDSLPNTDRASAELAWTYVKTVSANYTPKQKESLGRWMAKFPEMRAQW